MALLMITTCHPMTSNSYGSTINFYRLQNMIRRKFMYEKGSASLLSFSLAAKTKELVNIANKVPISINKVAKYLTDINNDVNDAINWCEKISVSGCNDASIKKLQTYAEFVKSWMNAINLSDVKSIQLWVQNGYRQALKKYYTLYAL